MTAARIARSSSSNILHRHERNQGLGATLRDGLARAVEMVSPRDIIITNGGDESHTSGLMLRMVRMIREGCGVVTRRRYQRDPAFPISLAAIAPAASRFSSAATRLRR
jgi:hypothetical protein